jgi:peroxiredoxin
MKRNTLIIVVVAIFVAALIYVGAVLSRRPRTSGVEAAVPDSGEAKVGRPAPDFRLQTLDGQELRLSSLQGKAVLVNFWATWCEPCKIEMPWIVELYNKYHPQGLEVLGVAMDDSGKEAIAKFAKDMKVDYPVLLGTDDVGDQYGGVQFLPQTFYIGRDGKITKSVNGIVSQSEIEDAIKQALAEGSPQTSANAAASPAASGKKAGK